MTTTSSLLFIHAHTALHPGTGTALGTVDLPIQRERHTGWPTIAGSSLKGVVRDHCRPSEAGDHRNGETHPGSDSVSDSAGSSDSSDSAGSSDSSDSAGSADSADSAPLQQWHAVFGPPTGAADLHAGAVSLTDARLLAFPVRSARSVFAWVTCPEALRRLERDATLVGGSSAAPPRLSEPPGEGTAFVLPGSDLLIAGSADDPAHQLLLEEYDFTVETSAAGCAETGEIARWIAERAVSDDLSRNRLQSHLVVLSNTEFTHFVRHATEVAARIGLDHDTKTVSRGALFYEEFLPAETLFHAAILASPSRRRSVELSADGVLDFVTSHLAERPVLQIGGDETIGRGLCAVRCPRESETSPENTP